MAKLRYLLGDCCVIKPVIPVTKAKRYWFWCCWIQTSLRDERLGILVEILIPIYSPLIINQRSSSLGVLPTTYHMFPKIINKSIGDLYARAYEKLHS